jgi:hypothetical protein
VWRYVAESVQGTQHDADGTPCQDACLVRLLGDAQDTLVACIADGAGSSKHSAIGARLACQAMLQGATSHFESAGSFAELSADHVLEWCDKAYGVISDEAEANGHSVREYASTLCTAIVTRHRAVFLQIGDGVIVACKAGVCGVVHWPQSGEYVNTTNFLTSSDYQEHVVVCEAGGGFTDIALLTDGMERLALRFDAFTAHLPFFKPLFGALRAANNLDVLGNDLRNFLQSESVRNKTDDDKTLVLASWLSADRGNADRDD